MKLLNFAFCAFLAISLISCDKDDDAQKDCTQADWVGTYTGTIDCGVAGSEAVTVTITASGANSIIIKYETNTLEVEYEPLMITKCDLDVMESGGGISITIDANINDGKLTLEEIYTISGETTTCSIDATRQ